MFDPVEFGKQMGGIVREAVAPLLKRLEALESRSLERGERGEKGERGESIKGDAGAEGERGRQGEKGDPGKDGKDGKDADAEFMITEVVARLIASDKLKALADLHAAEAVSEYMAANPVSNGKDGAPGLNGDRGEKGEQGSDGVGIAGFVIDRDGNLVATTTKGEAHNLGRIVGTNGQPGKDGEDGRDGLSMESVTHEYDAPAHEIVMRWVVSGATKELRYPAGGLRPGGFWREGLKSLAGQCVTHDGNLWLAVRDNASKPCTENTADWQLAARKGRDGRDGKDGKPPPGPVKLEQP